MRLLFLNFSYYHDIFITFTFHTLLYILVIALVTISSKYQITLPSDVREKMRLKAGDKVVFVEENDKFIMMRLDDLADQVLASFKDLDETEREFRKGFRFREE